MKRLLLLNVAITLSYLTASGQDPHFSQYFASPLMLNPALTGVFNGSLRIAGVYRNQWSSFAPFKTYAASVDGSFLEKSLNGDFVGAGMVFSNDISGEAGEFVTTQVNLSGSYNKRLSRSPQQYLTFGVEAGFVQRRLNLSNLRFGKLWEQGMNDDLMVNSNNYNASYIDLSTGILWFTRINKYTNLYGGFGLFHINRPGEVLVGGNSYRIQRKVAVHGGGELEMRKDIHMLPTMLLLIQGPSVEVNLGSYIKKILDHGNNFSLFAGAWYRIVSSEGDGYNSDAFIIATGMELRNVNVGFSYDLNVSGLKPVSKFRGGPELTLIVTTAMRSNKSGIRYCPKF